MTDREAGLIDRWRRERAAYDAWGAYVTETLTTAVAREIQPTATEMFFRIPVKPRTKEEASLLAKAFHRGKDYTDPYTAIEDKVGVRIVVLFSDEIRIVERALLGCDAWIASKARDFEEERAARPFVFDYQSVHYIVRSRQVVRHNGIEISADMPCEVQIRTILQHAYSELTHDTIYKPTIQAEPDVKRAVAKSMALIEATDDYFAEVRRKLDLAQAPGRQVAAEVLRIYREFVGQEPEPSPLNELLVDHFRGWAKEGFTDELGAFLREKSFLADLIKERAGSELLYRQPAILLAYWAVKQAPRTASLNAPLTQQEMNPSLATWG